MTSNKSTMISTFFLQLLLLSWTIEAFPDYQQAMPNGARVPHPCASSNSWPGVGHVLVSGAGPLNPFGRDFLANGKVWNRTLCEKDSDGDGRTNGQELGDPNCQWTPRSAPSVQDVRQLSHPGVCEPLDSARCSGRNEFLRTIDGCAMTMNLTLMDWCPAIKAPDVKTISLQYTETVLPSDPATLYYCQQFDVPDDQEYHVIAFEPIISNPLVMHHLIMFTCDTPEQEQKLATSGNYKKPSPCGLMPEECTGGAIGWAFGVPNVCYDNAYGIRLGKNAYRKVIMQIHYNNPKHYANMTDASGLKLYYTANKRSNDLAQLEIGQLDIAIPPRSRQLTRVVGKIFQTTECSVQTLQPHPSYNVTSVFIHMHQMGTRSRVTLRKRSGREITLVDEEYRYDAPTWVYFEAGRTPQLEPGDNLEVECSFKSMDKDEWTFFGEETSDEMCIAYLNVYPRIQNRDGTSLYVMGRLDECTMAQNMVDGCDMASFTANMTSWEMSAEGGLTLYCNDPALGYPASACTYACYEFMRSKSLFGHPCIRGSIFHQTASYNISMIMADIYQIRSQMERCSALSKPPKMSSKERIMAETLKQWNSPSSSTSSLTNNNNHNNNNNLQTTPGAVKTNSGSIITSGSIEKWLLSCLFATLFVLF